jgi:rare lipoprotein A
VIYFFFLMIRILSFVIAAALPTAASAQHCSQASYYGHGDGYAWQTMANGQPMNPKSMVTAHRSLPLGSKLLVSNPDNGRSVVVTVADRGPFVAGRDLDLSYGAFSRIASPGQGVARVCWARA